VQRRAMERAVAQMAQDWCQSASKPFPSNKWEMFKLFRAKCKSRQNLQAFSKAIENEEEKTNGFYTKHPFLFNMHQVICPQTHSNITPVTFNAQLHIILHMQYHV